MGRSSGGNVAAPGVPTSFVAIRTRCITLSTTPTCSPPTAGGAPGSYEIYRGTTATTVFQRTDPLVSMPVVARQATCTFMDDAGLASINCNTGLHSLGKGGLPVASLALRILADRAGLRPHHRRVLGLFALAVRRFGMELL